ncbi:unnamed protein product [Haemonchus placei]|uniref:Uncharacterized protein n=1 Tax=Haemonchus placei TaxID=6290 RepID=A0A0N4WXY5_HAEPC|nr:unnamed protein product [Haemonchus placei]
MRRDDAGEDNENDYKDDDDYDTTTTKGETTTSEGLTTTETTTTKKKKRTKAPKRPKSTTTLFNTLSPKFDPSREALASATTSLATISSQQPIRPRANATAVSDFDFMEIISNLRTAFEDLDDAVKLGVVGGLAIFVALLLYCCYQTCCNRNRAVRHHVIVLEGGHRSRRRYTFSRSDSVPRERAKSPDQITPEKLSKQTAQTAEEGRPLDEKRKSNEDRQDDFLKLKATAPTMQTSEENVPTAEGGPKLAFPPVPRTPPPATPLGMASRVARNFRSFWRRSHEGSKPPPMNATPSNILDAMGNVPENILEGPPPPPPPPPPPIGGTPVGVSGSADGYEQLAHFQNPYPSPAAQF